MKKILAALVSISSLFILSACSDSSELQTSMLTEPPEKTMELQNFEISPQDVNKKIASGSPFHLIDTRTPEEREIEHIKGDADHINSVDIESGKVAFEDYDKNEELIVYCRSGNRSARVYNVLKNLGFKNVKSMAGGINEWKKLGYNTCSESANTC